MASSGSAALIAAFSSFEAELFAMLQISEVGGANEYRSPVVSQP